MEGPAEIGGQEFVMALIYKIMRYSLTQNPTAWLLKEERIIFA